MPSKLQKRAAQIKALSEQLEAGGVILEDETKKEPLPITVIDWERYRKYYIERHPIEKAIVLRAFREWCRGNDCAEHWSSRDCDVAFQMFEAGVITGQVIAQEPGA